MPTQTVAVLYAVDHTLQGDTPPSSDAFALAVTNSQLSVSAAQVYVFSVGLQNPTKRHEGLQSSLSQLIKVRWELVYFTGSEIPSSNIVDRLMSDSSFLAPLALTVQNVTVTIEQGPSVAVIPSGNELRANYDDFLTLQSSVSVPYLATLAWSSLSSTKNVLPLSTILLSQSGMMSLDGAEVEQTDYNFPLSVVVLSSIFSPNDFYTFRLEVWNQSDPTTIVYDDVQVLINQPPCCGSLLVNLSQEQGSLYTLQALDWSDSQEGATPLYYQFFFQSTPLAPFLALSDRSLSNTLSTKLPSSSSDYGNEIAVVVVVESSYGAKANTTVSVATTPSSGASLSYFSSLQHNASNIGDVNMFLTALNGAAGTTLLPPCGQGADGNCMSSSAQKQCSSNSLNLPCSGHGNCSFYNSVGVNIDTCAWNDTSCTAYCRCDNGYDGVGCETTSLAADVQDQMRGQACLLLGNLSVSSNTSRSNALLSFLEIYQPQRIYSTQTFIACTELLLNTLLPSLPFGTNLGEFAVAATVTSIISAVGECLYLWNLRGYFQYAQPPGTDIIKSLVDTFTNRLQMNMIMGQTYNFSATNLQVSVVARTVDGIQSSILTPSDLSRSYVNFSGANFSECPLPIGVPVKVIVTQWALNPYPGSNDVITDLLGTSLALSSSPNTDMAGNASSSSSSSVYYMTLALTNLQNNTLLLPSVGLPNATFPFQCVTRDLGSYAPCSCSLSSYSNASAVFACKLKDNLCPSNGLSTSMASSSSALPSFQDANVIDIQHYAVSMNSAGVSSLVVAQNSRGVEAPVFIVAASLLLLLLAGVIFFGRWDSFDRRATKKELIVRDQNDDGDRKHYYQSNVDAAFLERISVCMC